MTFTFSLSSNDPNNPAFYYSIILFQVFLIFIITLLNNHQRKKRKTDAKHENLNKTLHLTKEQKILKWKYLSAYILTRASTWAKGPYLFTLYHDYHGFTVEQIGVLYIIDAVFSFISTPVFGSCADKYGRRLFSSLYDVFVVINVSLRITCIKSLAYIAQVFTGLGSTLLTTPFESWIVYESEKLYGDDSEGRELFLQDVFKDQALYDSICSIVVCSITAVLFTYFGIFVPLFFCILMASIGYCVIQFTWDENKPNSTSTVSTYESFFDALQELKKRDVLSVGIIESLWMACLNLFIFVWTPILQETTETGEMNVGFIFFTFVIMLIVGTLLFELLVIYLRMDYYWGFFVSLFTEFIGMGIVYLVPSFSLRMICLSFVNLCGGFFPPINSIIKSKILIEKYRATLMNIYKIPPNIYFIVVLLFLKKMAPITIVLIMNIMLGLAVLFTLSLIFFPVKEKAPSQKEEAVEVIEEDEKKMI